MSSESQNNQSTTPSVAGLPHASQPLQQQRHHGTPSAAGDTSGQGGYVPQVQQHNAAALAAAALAGYLPYQSTYPMSYATQQDPLSQQNSTTLTPQQQTSNNNATNNVANPNASSATSSRPYLGYPDQYQQYLQSVQQMGSTMPGAAASYQQNPYSYYMMGQGATGAQPQQQAGSATGAQPQQQPQQPQQPQQGGAPATGGGAQPLSQAAAAAALAAAVADYGYRGGYLQSYPPMYGGGGASLNATGAQHQYGGQQQQQQQPQQQQHQPQTMPQQQPQQQAHQPQQYATAGAAPASASATPAALSSSVGQIQPAGLRPRITTTMWEDEKTLCYQVDANGISVVRRADNNMINGTKLLNVAKMTRGRRDGILKSEKVRKVVKIGSMHLKGVWIPFERALLMLQREGIVDLLYPLFVKDIKRVIQQGTPTSVVGGAQDGASGVSAGGVPLVGGNGAAAAALLYRAAAPQSTPLQAAGSLASYSNMYYPLANDKLEAGLKPQPQPQQTAYYAQQQQPYYYYAQQQQPYNGYAYGGQLLGNGQEKK